MARAEQGGLGTGRLHTKLVALFSVIAAVPTVLVAIFASLLFQSGLEFWFSDRARNMLENTVEVAQGRLPLRAVERRCTKRWPMAGDVADYLTRGVDRRSAASRRRLAVQFYHRSLNEAAIVTLRRDR